jgi:hypothetical protein
MMTMMMMIHGMYISLVCLWMRSVNKLGKKAIKPGYRRKVRNCAAKKQKKKPKKDAVEDR